jgi:hypothetical protein
VLEANLKAPLFSYASDASPEFMETLRKLTNDMGNEITNKLTIEALGSDKTVAFNAVRDGEVIHLMYPQLVKKGDLLAALITALASSIPNCVIHECSAGWAEPEWSAESRKHLGGLLMALQVCPESFAHTSHPSDLARISLWINTCSAALSRPGGVTDAHGDVLPDSVGGSKSASKYLSKVIAGLRSNVTDDSMTKSIETLSMLLKLWQKENYEKSLTIVRKCKLKWSTVLFRAAPTQVIKGKRNKPDQTVIRSPPKPSRSPWLSGSERSELGNIFKDKWSFIDGFRDRFVALTPEQQHRQFNSFIRDIKREYEKLLAISNSVHAKLGRRKYWIERVCKADKYEPKVKKGESESFLLAAHFFKKDLTKLNQPVKKAFAPVCYLDEDPYSTKTTWGKLYDQTNEEESFRCSAADFDSEDGTAWKLWQIWADMFLPVFVAGTVSNEDAPCIDSYNPFQVLPAETPAA